MRLYIGIEKQQNKVMQKRNMNSVIATTMGKLQDEIMQRLYIGIAKQQRVVMQKRNTMWVFVTLRVKVS